MSGSEEPEMGRISEEVWISFLRDEIPALALENWRVENCDERSGSREGVWVRDENYCGGRGGGASDTEV